jgi:hypothetical protein
LEYDVKVGYGQLYKGDGNKELDDEVAMIF